MPKHNETRIHYDANCQQSHWRRCYKVIRRILVSVPVIATMTLSACGGKSSSTSSQSSATLQGNWQFTMAHQTDGNSSDPTFSGGLLGGFLLQSNGTITGQTVYSVTSSAAVPGAGACNGGSAPANVVLNGQNVTITEVAGSQTYTLTGTLSSNGSGMAGTYNATAGTASDGSACGYAVAGLSWSAVLVPPLSGSIKGSFHSGGTADNSGLLNQDFPVTGSLTQGDNIGGTSATITGTLSFIDPSTGQSDYPCIPLGTVSVNGQISGNTVILQLIDVNGSSDGQIGIPLSQVTSSTGLNVVTLDSTTNGYTLHSSGQAYVVNTKSCPNNASGNFEDVGFICLALNGSSACQQPISLSPPFLAFPQQILGTAPTQQTITLTNESATALSGLALQLNNNNTYSFGGSSDFNGLTSFTESDSCGSGGAASQGQAFSLTVGQSCSISVTFSPQEGCPWLPFGTPPSTSGAPPEWCPLAFQGWQLAVTSPTSTDNDNTFVVPVTGIGLSAIQPSTREIDFGAEEQFNPPESSLPQSISFTNTSTNPVQILGPAPCVNPLKGPLILPAPRQASSSVAGVQVVGQQPGVNNPIAAYFGATAPTISYNCDSDSGTSQPNFQVSSDTCTGSLLAPQQGCSLQVTYIPQPNTALQGGADYFIELNTLQCWPAGTLPSASNPCEIDSGRFPVELRANPASPLRMSPGAGLDFGTQSVGTKSGAMTITLTNDPELTNPQTVTFVGRILASSGYSESDDCPASLAPGGSCTLSITFKPGSVGLIPGTLTINYTPEPTSSPQIVRLRGTGQ